ncbi:MAG TPA: long-chain fatty acid--CoA ligase [Solirubrobacterales bacterium]|nr:long-chain fatty acid--CoA ligase [Solirubrobacterales bacterium]
MDGLMMDRPLLVKQIAERAETVFGDREVVARTQDGVERSTYRDVVGRARRLAGALVELGVGPGDRIATFAWNSLRHLELYLAVPSMGAVLHTLNVRLFEEHLRFIVEHAADRVLFIDSSLADAIPRLDGPEREILMPDGPGQRTGALDYEELVAGGDPEFQFPELGENAAAAMCYTSGTTGRPKGVLYSHRSIVLHTLGAALPDSMGIREHDSAMPVVPMFHALAWGIPYAAAMVGARQVLPGPDLSPDGLAELITAERVTWSAGVPTIWNGVLELDPPPDLSSLRELKAGGSAVPESLIRAFEERFGVPLVQGWGMTETSPLAATSRLPAGAELTDEEAYALRATQGRVVPLIDFRVDPEAGGELQVRGPWIARAYYGDEGDDDRFTEDGWLRTGDVAEIERGAFIKLVDRTKDLVKSGGEWISSVVLENEIMAHPDVIEAAVIAVPDERWGERPCACVVARDGAAIDPDALRAHLDGRVAKYWIPDRFEFVDEVPKTSVGKFDKKLLRERFARNPLTVGSESNGPRS